MCLVTDSLEVNQDTVLNKIPLSAFYTFIIKTYRTQRTRLRFVSIRPDASSLLRPTALAKGSRMIAITWIG